MPYVKDETPEDSAYLTVRQMQAKYGVLVDVVEEVYDKAFVTCLRKYYIDAGARTHPILHIARHTIQMSFPPRYLYGALHGCKPIGKLAGRKEVVDIPCEPQNPHRR